MNQLVYPDQIPVAEHAQELLSRRIARKDIRQYIRYLRPSGLLDVKYDPAQHHNVFLNAALNMVENPSKNNRQLMVSLPPGAGKSVYLSVLLPCFLLCRNPQIQILCIAPSDTLSEKFARQRREICRTPEWQRLAENSLSKDAQSLTFMAVPQGGYIRSASIGASIMGQRCDIVLVDEVATSFEQANSIGQMEKVKDWYLSTARTRLSPRGCEILLSTRWSTADLIQVFLDAKDSGDEPGWQYIRMPMICDDINDPTGRQIGDRLFPEWYTEEQVRIAQLNPVLWKTLYQQLPIDSLGSWISTDHFHIVNQKPQGMKYLMGCDLALSVGKGDWSVAVVAGIDTKGDLYIVDMYRGQVASNLYADEIIRLFKQYKPQWVLFDNSNTEKMFSHTLTSQCRLHNTALPFHMLPIGNRDKEDRASILRAKMMQDQVKFLRQDWTNVIYNEVLSFPSPTVHDDIIDCMSLIARQMSKVSPPKPAVPVEQKTAFRIGEGGTIECMSSLDEMFDDNERAKRQYSFQKNRI